MLRLPQRLLPARHRSGAYHCVLRFPDSTETRLFSQVPTPGTRLRSHGGHFYLAKVWVVAEALQSGRDTYTVFLTSRSEYLDHLRHESNKPDLAVELLELARHTTAAGHRTEGVGGSTVTISSRDARTTPKPRHAVSKRRKCCRCGIPPEG